MADVIKITFAISRLSPRLAPHCSNLFEERFSPRLPNAAAAVRGDAALIMLTLHGPASGSRHSRRRAPTGCRLQAGAASMPRT